MNIAAAKFALTCFLLFCIFPLYAVAHEGESELIKTFLELENVPEPLRRALETAKKSEGRGDLRDFVRNLEKALVPRNGTKNHPDDPTPAIPYLIGLIDADNFYDTVYFVGYFILGRLTEVPFSPYHDGAWWRRWWEKNKENHPDDVRKIEIPTLPKTKHGKSYVPFPPEMDMLQGQLDYLRMLFDMTKQERNGDWTRDFSSLARSIAEFKDPTAIPYLIGAIDADNSYDTVYGIGYFGLGKQTGVSYKTWHDGAWWRRWWEKNKPNFPEDVQKISIPDFPKTAYGKTHVPFPSDLDTLQGQLNYLRRNCLEMKKSKGRPEDMRYFFRDWREEIVLYDDPTAIPYLIALIATDGTEVSQLELGFHAILPLAGIKDNTFRDADWWRKWWEENRKNYPSGVAKIDVPDINAEWDIPDLGKEVAEWRWQKENSERKSREEKMLREINALDSDVADVSGVKTAVAGHPKMEYFLIGLDETKTAPEDGYKLLVIMPGGDGSAEFHPFVRRIFKHAALPLEENFIAAQPIAVKWTPKQQIVWPTENDKLDKREFSTEAFIETVIADVFKRTKIDPKHVYTLSWSSSGPAAYAISLQEKTAVTGSYVTMSVFKPNELPPLDRAKDRMFVVEHSPEDRVCPFRMAKDAEEKLTRHGAVLKFVKYEGGHGWRGNLYGRLRENLRWMIGKNRK